MASLVGKSSWAVSQDRPSERGSQRNLECFLIFFATEEGYHEDVDMQNHAEWFYVCSTHEYMICYTP